MTERELLEQIAAQVGALDKKVDSIDKKVNSIEANTKQELAEIRANMATKDDLADVKSNLTRVKEIVVKIENEHGQKLGALFDGYTQNADKLNRIEKIVARHEETILTKVK